MKRRVAAGRRRCSPFFPVVGASGTTNGWRRGGRAVAAGRCVSLGSTYACARLSVVRAFMWSRMQEHVRTVAESRVQSR